MRKEKTIASTTDLQPPYEDYKSSVIVAAMSGVASFLLVKRIQTLLVSKRMDKLCSACKRCRW